jgi:hypothetical protein
VSTLILVAALACLACLLLLWCCCRVAAWADRRMYADPVSPPGNTPDAGNVAGPPCPLCGIERPWGPQEMIFPDGGSETFWRCRSCGREYWSRDVAPGRCWGVGG